MRTTEERLKELEQKVGTLTTKLDGIETETKRQTPILQKLDKAITDDGPWRENTKRWVGRLCFMQKLCIAACISGAATFGAYVVTRLTTIDKSQQQIKQQLNIPEETK